MNASQLTPEQQEFIEKQKTEIAEFVARLKEIKAQINHNDWVLTTGWIYVKDLDELRKRCAGKLPKLPEGSIDLRGISTGPKHAQIFTRTEAKENANLFRDGSGNPFEAMRFGRALEMEIMRQQGHAETLHEIFTRVD